MMQKKTLTVGGLLALLALLAGSALAAPYLLDDGGRPVINQHGQCFRTVEWRPDLAIKECDPLYWQVAQAKKRRREQARAQAAAAEQAAPTAASAAASGAAAPAAASAAPVDDSRPVSPIPASFQYVELQPLVLNTDTSFHFGDFHLTPEGKEALQALAGLLALREAEQLKIHVVGHTDRVGSEKANRLLGLKRAQAVKDALVAMGVDGKDIDVESKGSSEPVTQRQDCPDTLVKCELIDCLRPDRRVVIFTKAKVAVHRRVGDGVGDTGGDDGATP